MEEKTRRRGRTALVVGGSMAGLVAARVLSHHYDEVGIVERDVFPEQPTARDGVPQSHQPHIFLVRGLKAAEVLFPGLYDEMLEAGGQRGNGIDWRVVTPVGVAQPAPLEQDSIGATRPLFEWCVRRRVSALANVRFLTNTDVTDLVVTPDRQRVTGVRVRYRRGASGPDVLSADLVVDASGRHSKAPAWLETLGYGRPPEECVDVGVGYSSRLYHRPAAFAEPWKNLYIMPRPPHQRRLGAMAAVEGNCWFVSIGGAAGEQPPTDEDGFLAWARALPDLRLYHAIRQAEPASRVHGFRIPTTQWRHFERLARWPEGFLVLGDAVCAFNPFYGQGMTVAALEALALGDVLQSPPRTGWEQHVQQRVAKVVRDPWTMALNEDLRMGGVRSDGQGVSLDARLAEHYLKLLMPAVCADEAVSVAYFKVFNMLEPPTSLMRPSVLFRVLRHALRGTRRSGSPADLQVPASDALYPEKRKVAT